MIRPYLGTQSVPLTGAADAWPGQVIDPGRLVPITFSTQGIVSQQQFDLWFSKYESFNTLHPLKPVEAGFEGRNEIWPFGSMALMRNSAPAMAFERTMRHIRRDAIDHWVIRVARSGGSRMRIGDTTLRSRAGHPLLFTLGQPHEGERSEADWISLYIRATASPRCRRV